MMNFYFNMIQKIWTKISESKKSACCKHEAWFDLSETNKPALS